MEWFNKIRDEKATALDIENEGKVKYLRFRYLSESKLPSHEGFKWPKMDERFRSASVGKHIRSLIPLRISLYTLLQHTLTSSVFPFHSRYTR